MSKFNIIATKTPEDLGTIPFNLLSFSFYTNKHGIIQQAGHWKPTLSTSKLLTKGKYGL